MLEQGITLLGSITFVIGLAAALAGIVWAAAEVCYSAAKRVYGFAWIYEAMQHYKTIKPPPRVAME